jgi:glycosyltransferase involved in cell wall biosynthesis
VANQTSTLLIVAKNEYENMRLIMPQVDRNWCDRILLLDGRSTDGTAEYARQLGFDVIVESKPGCRNGLVDAFKTIKTDFVVVFSPDGNCPPEDIPRLLEKLRQGYDVVIGSRYLGEAKSEDDTPASAWANWIFTFFINKLFGGNLTDSMTMYRGFRPELFFKLKLDQHNHYKTAERLFGLVQGGLGYEPLMSARMARHCLNYIEIPSNEPKRLCGEAKFPKVQGGLAYLLQLLQEKVRLFR